MNTGVTSAQLLWLVPALPMVAALVVALLPSALERLAARIACAGIGLSLVAAIFPWQIAKAAGFAGAAWNTTWFVVGGQPLHLGFLNDPASTSMAVMVAAVGLLVGIFAISYMEGDKRYSQFFAFFAFFVGAMQGVVVSNNLLQLFVFWELVGLASYLLIGFWFHKPSALMAARKAFLVTRVGDIGLLLGMVWLFNEAGTLTFFDDGHGLLEASVLQSLRGMPGAVGGLATVSAIGLLLMLGALGKSGQFPFSIWLPDAMEGPTPVSALIHAATMVAAGVFLLVRLDPVLSGSFAMEVVAWAGAVTALWGAVLGVAQRDIKRVLAFSTVSQLGLMMLAVGCGAPGAAMLHLLSHALFKALLFLGAGSVIHACHHEQDVLRLGGLSKYMKITWVTFVSASAALCGLPLTSGFFSKDAVLASAWHHHPVLFALGMLASVGTAFYMARLVVLVFRGDFRGEHHHGAGHVGRGGVVQDAPAESPATMWGPMAVLTAGCLPLFGMGSGLVGWIAPWVPQHGEHTWWIFFVSGAVVLGVGGWGWRYFSSGTRAVPDRFAESFPGLCRQMQNQFGVDRLLSVCLPKGVMAGARLIELLDAMWEGAIRIISAGIGGLGWCLSKGVEHLLLNGGLDKVCSSLQQGGTRTVRAWHSGSLPSYLRWGVAGVVGCVAFFWVWWR
jgi:NADH-quinone oxidoreductase subunit L